MFGFVAKRLCLLLKRCGFTKFRKRMKRSEDFFSELRKAAVVRRASGGRTLCNALQLGEVAGIEAQMFSFVQKFNRRTVVEFSTESVCFFYLDNSATKNKLQVNEMVSIFPQARLSCRLI